MSSRNAGWTVTMLSPCAEVCGAIGSRSVILHAPVVYRICSPSFEDRPWSSILPFRVPVSVHPIVQDPPFVIVLFLLATAIGFRVLRTARITAEDGTRLERGVISAVIGLGLLQYLPFGLGVAGVLTPRALWIGLLSLCAVFAFDMLAVARAVAKMPSPTIM